MKNYFGGRQPSHYHMNYIVKAFIMSEGFFWSGYNFVFPILSIFVVEQIVGGTIELAATAVSAYMISRVITELLTGKILEGQKDQKKLKMSIAGITIVAIAYFSFSFINQPIWVYVLQGVIGIGLGIASPAKYSLFAQHLNKKRSSNEWSVYDAVTFIGMALSSALGGFIAHQYGFAVLFKISGVMIFLGTLPYIFTYHFIEKN